MSHSIPGKQLIKAMVRKPTSNRKKQRRGSDSARRSGSDTHEPEYKVGPGRPPKEYQFKPGESGNPKGAKRKPASIEPGLKAALEYALNKKVRLTDGEKERVITRAQAGMEQLVNQYARGDHRARRDLIAIADKLGVDLIGGQRKTLEAALASNQQAILDAYVARKKSGKTSKRPPVFAPPELLDDDPED